MYNLSDIKELNLLKTSKMSGTKFTIKLEDKLNIFIHDKNTDIVYKISILKSNSNYIIKSDEYSDKVFFPNGDAQMIYFNPVIIAKVGTTSKNKDSIYFIVDDNIDLYA
jgi:hypothetical protein